jgi:hypothetical protein
MSKQIVEQVRAKYPTPLGARHGAFLLEVAAALRKGLVRKSWGTFVTLPDGTGVSQDCVMDPNGIHYDVLGDGENLATPAWSLVTEEGTDKPLILPADRYYAVTAAPVPVPPPPPPPDPPPPAEPAPSLPDLSSLIAVLLSMSARVEAMEADLKATRGELTAALTRPWPDYTTRILGQTVTLSPRK